MLTVKILSSSCSKCEALEQRVRHIVIRHHLPVQVEKVTDLREMMKYGIMMTPGLVVDGVVKSVGMVPKDEQLLEWMKGSAT